MANYTKIIPFILRWEGGFVNDPLDKGGATNKGVTLGTYRQFYGATATVEQLKNITVGEWNHIFKSGYWNKWKADEIRSQPVAKILVDWLWLSGSPAIKLPQRLLGVAPDGVVGAQTIAAVNTADAKKLFADIMAARVQYINDIIVRTPTNERFRKGWMNRLDALKFEE
jgi:lysozyme family protein